MKEIADMLFEAKMLKDTPRAGFAFLGAGRESVAEHSFAAAFIAYVMSKLAPDVDALRLISMCLIHDLPEARIGDLNYVQKRYVRADEERAIADATQHLPFGQDMSDLLAEFNSQQTKAARLAHDADQLAFILDLKTDGVEILRNEEKMGIKGSYTTAVNLNNVKIPKENLLGSEGDGFKIAMETLNGGRIGIAAQALGIAEGAFEKAKNYAMERKQFGKPIGSFQAIQFKLADMMTRIEAAKLITYKAAWLKDMKKTNAIESAMSKLYASEAASYVAAEAVQIHGGYGYITEYEVERMMRDAKITEIYEGTNEVQRITISKMLMK